MRSGFESCALEPRLTGLCINMMHPVASYLCRGIEVVITGLTRNQFVPKAHEGSNPSLCAKNAVAPFGAAAFFFWRRGRGFSPCTVRCEGSHTAAAVSGVLRGNTNAQYKRLRSRRNRPHASRIPPAVAPFGAAAFFFWRRGRGFSPCTVRCFAYCRSGCSLR